MPLPQEKRKYTYEDYLSWDEDEHIEIIDGVPYYTYGDEIIEGAPVMQAAPSTSHQTIITELIYKIRSFLEGKPCRVFPAPFSVWLESDDTSALEPDITIVCDPSKLTERGCKGAPDVIIEILSPSTARKDRIIKLDRYERAGVREYWMIDPDTKTLQACILENDRYFIKGYTETATVPSKVLTGMEIKLSDVFVE